MLSASLGQRVFLSKRPYRLAAPGFGEGAYNNALSR